MEVLQSCRECLVHQAFVTVRSPRQLRTAIDKTEAFGGCFETEEEDLQRRSIVEREKSRPKCDLQEGGGDSLTAVLHQRF